MRFLTRLNENFSSIRTQILMLDPLPTMTHVMYLVTQYERQIVEVSALPKPNAGYCSLIFTC